MGKRTYLAFNRFTEIRLRRSSTNFGDTPLRRHMGPKYIFGRNDNLKVPLCCCWGGKDHQTRAITTKQFVLIWLPPQMAFKSYLFILCLILAFPPYQLGQLVFVSVYKWRVGRRRRRHHHRRHFGSLQWDQDIEGNIKK